VIEGEAATVSTVLNPLLRALEMLAFVARHLHPPHLAELLDSIGKPDDALKTALAAHSPWPDSLSAIKQPIDEASETTLQAFTVLRRGIRDRADVRRALRLLPKALETLYPLAGILPTVNLFFLDPSLRTGSEVRHQFLVTPARENTGVMRFDAESGERGGFWLYVPETYTPKRTYPLVMALHGGSGTGRLFLWSWLRDARSHAAILASPTSVGSTWALMGTDADTPNLSRVLSLVRSKWNIDPTRLLLTGMSDGGTFTYLSGLEAASPFTHLAPVAGAFHPMLVQMADADRIRGLPIHIVHGALDWMFPVELARQASRTLSKAGAAVTYREVDDLSHTYPRELNARMLDWLNGRWRT
jgi:phospholipase/carboxylesterase